jgi:serine/threonine protein kinase
VVALKLFSKDWPLDRLRRVAQLRREAPEGGRLAGTAVLPVYDFGEVKGYPYITMPLIDGPTLSDILFERRRREADGPEAGGHPLVGLPEPDYLREVVRLLAWITRALAALHELGVVHCDVKPGNILLDQDGRAYLCDFGLAHLVDEVRPEAHGQTTGTPIYMACEKLLGWLDVDEARCDVYSMGVTLYEATTLERPFHIPGDLPRSDWSAYLAVATARRPRAVRPDLPKDLEAIILRAMERDLARRYPSAAALADDLDRFLAGPADGAGSR